MHPLAGTVPAGVTHFGVGTGKLLAAMRTAGADVVGADGASRWNEAARRLGAGGPCVSVDPALLRRVGRGRVRRVVAHGGRGAAGHIFNLVPPDS